MEPTRIRTRPVGVIIVALVYVVGAPLNLAVAADLLGFAGSAPVAGRGDLAGPVGLLMLLAAAVSLPTAYGVYAMTSWGWALGVGLGVLAFVQNVAQYLNDGSLLVAMVVSAIVPALILWYLLRTNVRALFAGTA